MTLAQAVISVVIGIQTLTVGKVRTSDSDKVQFGTAEIRYATNTYEISETATNLISTDLGPLIENRMVKDPFKPGTVVTNASGLITNVDFQPLK